VVTPERTTTKKLRWGVLGAAKIATVKVIPAMQQGAVTEVVALASRDSARAAVTARSLGIARVYGSYDELLDDPDIDAVYNPLPNHLHVPWTIRAAMKGKHVLCEKPLGLTVSDTEQLVETRTRTGMRIQEAFMVRVHPQWLRAIEIVRSGRIGTLAAMIGGFSYFNDDPANVRNVPEFGGGGLLDIGCYFVMTSRWVFGREPSRVVAAMDRDPKFGVDRLASMILDYGSGTFTGTCATQMVSHQRVQILGTRGRIEIEIPFNAPPDRSCRIVVDPGTDVFGTGSERIELPICDQYTLQGDAFSRAVLDGTPEPYPLEESIGNMRVLDALARSAAIGSWVNLT
jgi:predicted dehydrogenase